MKIPETIDPKRITTFELGDAYCEDQIALIVPREHLEHLHDCIHAIIEHYKNSDINGYYLTYRGVLHEVNKSNKDLENV